MDFDFNRELRTWFTAFCLAAILAYILLNLEQYGALAWLGIIAGPILAIWFSIFAYRCYKDEQWQKQEKEEIAQRLIYVGKGCDESFPLDPLGTEPPERTLVSNQ